MTEAFERAEEAAADTAAAARRAEEAAARAQAELIAEREQRQRAEERQEAVERQLQMQAAAHASLQAQLLELTKSVQSIQGEKQETEHARLKESELTELALRELAQQQEVLEAQQQESELARIKAAIVLLREQQRSLESALEELNDAELAEDVDDDSREAMAGARRVAEDELATTVAQLAAAEAQLIAAEDARRQALSPPYKEFGNFGD